MKKLLFCVLVLMATAAVAGAARTTFDPPIYPVPCDTSARPDSFGYAWVDNDNGGSPVYNWIDITGNGVRVNGLQDDNVIGPVSLGFIFPYYWYRSIVAGLVPMAIFLSRLMPIIPKHLQ
jgi:hypothetical protein